MSDPTPLTTNELTMRVQRSGLHVEVGLDDLITDRLLPGTGVSGSQFYEGLAGIVSDLTDKNTSLLSRRNDIQADLNDWYRSNSPDDTAAAKQHLEQIGYLVPEGPDFAITTDNVDAEIATIAGPQLVVPVNNARYCINAANARWGSLYDALYGTDVIASEGDLAIDKDYNPQRGAEVIRRAMQFLDDAVRLDGGSFHDITGFVIEPDGDQFALKAFSSGGAVVGLRDPNQFVGFEKVEDSVSSVVLLHHGLHIELVIDPDDAIGRQHPAGIKDVILESAVTTIQDCEDSVAAVDAADKTLVYRNWLGLMKGTLQETFDKGGRQITRSLNADKVFQSASGGELVLHGRSLLLVRNVGQHMMTDAVLTQSGDPIPEGFLDAMVTSAAALHDLKRIGKVTNSRTGSIYIVKPKQHGPDEVAATVELFGRVEAALGLPHKTIKLGIMDEERRTTVNLKECIRAAASRVVFINTGFLDRTGDEIHTLMAAGAQVPKPEIKNAKWLSAYEDWNVDIGNETRLPGKAQIGKGMWPAPDNMAAMMEAKIGHVNAGANCAWVPSPTAATLHALHYHRVSVADRQAELSGRPRASLDDILTPSLLGDRSLTEEQIRAEIDNNLQGILGYVVRWIELGVGCSKVPDLGGVGLMEDRATLRISSQMVANWLHHGVVNDDLVMDRMRHMAAIVDDQNAATDGYRPMSPDFDDSHAFAAAVELVFGGLTAANGYTETTLTKFRRLAKQSS